MSAMIFKKTVTNKTKRPPHVSVSDYLISVSAYPIAVLACPRNGTAVPARGYSNPIENSQSKTRPHCTSKKDSENFLSPLFLFSCIYLCVVVLGNR